jgi:hypothetical protein
MKRYSTVKRFLTCINDNDIVIVFGNELCKEVFQNDRSGFFYITDSDSASLAFPVGLAMTTDKRVFVLVGEGTFVRDISSIAQAGVSECSNLFYIVFDNGCYQSSGGQPNIAGSIVNMKGVVFSLGFIAHDFSDSFRSAAHLKDLKSFIRTLKGPMVVEIRVDRGVNKKLKDISLSEVELKDRFIYFIENVEGTSMSVQPSTINLSINGG